MAEQATCPEYVHDDYGVGANVCGRPVKGEHDGKAMCGIHLRAARQRAEREQRWRSEREQGDQLRAQAEAMAERFKALGYEASPDWSPFVNRNRGGYTGAVTLGANSAADLLDKLERT